MSCCGWEGLEEFANSNEPIDESCYERVTPSVSGIVARYNFYVFFIKICYIFFKALKSMFLLNIFKNIGKKENFINLPGNIFSWIYIFFFCGGRGWKIELELSSFFFFFVLFTQQIICWPKHIYSFILQQTFLIILRENYFERDKEIFLYINMLKRYFYTLHVKEILLYINMLKRYFYTLTC